MSNQTNLCPTCCTEVSELAVTCPKCGRPLLIMQTSTTTYVVGGKNKIVAGLLAIFLGSLGIHFFYLGQAIKGGLMLGFTIILTFISFILIITIFLAPVGFLLLFILGIYCLVTGILYFVMNDQRFNEKYNGMQNLENNYSQQSNYQASNKTSNGSDNESSDGANLKYKEQQFSAKEENINQPFEKIRIEKNKSNRRRGLIVFILIIVLVVIALSLPKIVRTIGLSKLKKEQAQQTHQVVSHKKTLDDKTVSNNSNISNNIQSAPQTSSTDNQSAPQQPVKAVAVSQKTITTVQPVQKPKTVKVNSGTKTQTSSQSTQNVSSSSSSTPSSQPAPNKGTHTEKIYGIDVQVPNN